VAHGKESWIVFLRSCQVRICANICTLFDRYASVCGLEGAADSDKLMLLFVSYTCLYVTAKSRR
jgi:hypothetical protein